MPGSGSKSSRLREVTASQPCEFQQVANIYFTQPGRLCLHVWLTTTKYKNVFDFLQ